MFRLTTYPLPARISAALGIAHVTLKPVQLHSLSLAMFCSIIAPFGGLFASGLKRALKKKDFGDIIPGHGGMTDRFDCQILMAAFSHFYVRSFLTPRSVTVAMAMELVRQLSRDKQGELLKWLTQETALP